MEKSSGGKKPDSGPRKSESRQTVRTASVQENRLSKQQAFKPTSEWKAGWMESRVVHLLIITVLCLLAYSNTFNSPFQWDEVTYLKENPFVKDLSFFLEPSRAEGIFNAVLKSRYIGFLTFALNYKLHGFNVFGYHVVNLAIHLTNAMLVYFLVLLTFRTPFMRGQGSGVRGQRAEDTPLNPPLPRGEVKGGAVHVSQWFPDSLFTTHYSRFFALAVALLFVSHPIQTEAVTYVFQRFASLVSMFYILSLVLYIKGRLSVATDDNSPQPPLNLRGGAEGGGVILTIHDSRFTIIWYLLSLLSAVLAMKTKENAFTLPVLITLYEFLFFKGPLKFRALRLAPFLLSMVIIPMTRLGMERTPEDILQIQDLTSMGFQDLPRNDYLFTQFRVIVTYIRLLFLPVNQNLFYDYPFYSSFFAPVVILSFMFLATLFGLAVFLLYKSRLAEKRASVQDGSENEAGAIGYSLFTLYCFRLIGFGILWFFITLSVESSIIPIPMVINEYRIYLPSIGFFIAVTATLLLLVQKFLGSSMHKFKVAVSLFSLVVLALTSATYARNTVWKDKVSMWEDVVSKTRRSPTAYNNLGLAYHEKGLYEEAIAKYQRAIAILPVFVDPYVNLGVTYSAVGRPDLTIAVLSKVISMEPQHPKANFNLARAYVDFKQHDKAIEYYLKSIQLDPYNASAFHGLGTVYARLGRLDDALNMYNNFAMLSPNDPEAYRNRGVIYMKKGDYNNFVSDFQKACSLGSKESCEFVKKNF